MKYRFLAAWVEENAREKLLVRDFCRQGEQFFLVSKSGRILQINLEADGYCFYTRRRDLLPGARRQPVAHLLEDCVLLAVTILPTDRIMHFRLGKTDAYNQQLAYVLVVELTGPRANWILCRDNEQMEVVDCYRKIGLDDPSGRLLLPGRPYEPPAPPPFTPELGTAPLYTLADKGLVDGAEQGYTNLNEALEELFYEYRQKRTQQAALAAALRETARRLAAKQAKLVKQQTELAELAQAEQYKQWAELIKTGLHSIKPGDAFFKTTNWYLPDAPETEIPLLPEKHPRACMEFYFKKYKKGVSGRAILQKQIEQTEAEITALQSGETTFDEAGVSGHSAGQVKAPPGLRIKCGVWEIIIGRTARENDLVTQKLSAPADWWFHSRIYRGAHVLLKNRFKLDPPQNILLLCCRLAAYYSRAKNSSQVPVDYTQIRYVRKPRGAAAGFVIYTHQKTVFAEPLSHRDGLAVAAGWEEENRG